MRPLTKCQWLLEIREADHEGSLSGAFHRSAVSIPWKSLFLCHSLGAVSFADLRVPLLRLGLGIFPGWIGKFEENESCAAACAGPHAKKRALGAWQACCAS